jgi:hypothetical protein
MDPIGSVVNLIALIQTTRDVIAYCNEVKEGAAERQQLRSELETVMDLCHRLQTHINERKATNPADHAALWFKGPMEQMSRVLSDICKPLGVDIAATGLDQTQQNKALPKWKRTKKVLAWPFKREDIKGYLVILERQQGYINLALELDVMFVNAIAGAQYVLTSPQRNVLQEIQTDFGSLKVDTAEMKVLGQGASNEVKSIGKKISGKTSPCIRKRGHSN